jgi:hypothetical protein
VCCVVLQINRSLSEQLCRADERERAAQQQLNFYQTLLSQHFATTCLPPSNANTASASSSSSPTSSAALPSVMSSCNLASSQSSPGLAALIQQQNVKPLRSRYVNALCSFSILCDALRSPSCCAAQSLGVAIGGVRLVRSVAAARRVRGSAAQCELEACGAVGGSPHALDCHHVPCPVEPEPGHVCCFLIQEKKEIKQEEAGECTGRRQAWMGTRQCGLSN